MMRFTYSPTDDTLAVELADAEGIVVRDEEVAPDTVLEFDKDGRLVGIEIEQASLHYAKEELEKHGSPVVELSLEQASKESGLDASTLRWQIRNKRLKAVKRAGSWFVARHDLWNYLETRAPAGRPAKRRKARRPKVAALQK